MKRMIGVLLDHGTWCGIPRNRTGSEKISFYKKAAQKQNVGILYFSLPHVELRKNRTKGYIWKKGSYLLVNQSIPAVIHNRSMPSTSHLMQKLRNLARKKTVFNKRTRYSKYHVHRLLVKKGSINAHLPRTISFSRKNLKKMMNQFSSIYVKPVSSSIGRGVIRIVRKDDKCWTVQAVGKPKAKKEQMVYPYLKKKIKGRKYLLQEAIPLAHYKGKPFDIRVSVQKSGDGEWQVTGMVGKVAAKGSHVTNVARGGKVKPCEKLFKACGLNVDQTRQAVEAFSLKVAKRLGKKLKNLADIGLDVGIDKEGIPYFIEMNGRDLRYSFRNAKLKRIWYKTYENPIKYGIFLMKRQK